MTSNIKLLTVGVDLVCFLLVVVELIVAKVLIYSTETGLYPNKRGFHCDDISIQRPIAHELVPYEINAILSFIIPVTVTLIVELMNNLSKSGENELAAAEEEEVYGPFSLKPWIVSIMSLVFAFCFGAFLTENITDLAKVTVGRLRPTFRAHCKANLSPADCQHGYITRDVCTGDPYDVKMARLSFPSGHSSLSMYAMLFLVFYLQTAVRTDTKLLKPLLQIVAVSLALFIGLSRVADNSHFFSDVFAGFVLGGIMAWFIIFKVLKLFSIRIRKPRVYTLVPQQSRTPIKDDVDD